MTLLLLNYNNYYNRIIKKETSVDNYIADTKHKYVTGVNFNPNDGITTDQIINWAETWNPDYCVVIDKNSSIVSRWFIIESQRTRGGQYKISLKRDSIADYLDEIKEAPALIQNGYVSRSNPLIYNQEGLNLNQIKSSETTLMDKSKCSWLVAYYDKSKKSELTGTVTTSDDIPTIATFNTTFDNWVYKDYCQGNGVYKAVNDWRYKFFMKSGTTGSAIRRTYTVNKDGAPNTFEITYTGTATLVQEVNKPAFYLTDTAEKVTSGGSILENTANTFLSESVSFDTLKSYIGNVQFSDGIYNIRILPVQTSTSTKTMTTSDAIYTALRNLFYVEGELDDNYSGSINADTFTISADYQEYTIVGTKISDNTVNYDFSGSHNEIEDQPYGIIALPYIAGQAGLKFGNTSYTYTIDTNLSMAILQNIITEGAGATANYIYDTQIIPFCPIPEVKTSTATVGGKEVEYINLSLLPATSYEYIKDSNDTTVGFVLYPTQTKFTGNITKSITTEAFSDDANYNVKLENECTMYRLCSPNFNGQYEFNVAKNGGRVAFFNYDVALKPYQPYIHVNPDFKDLYGADYNDPRGLVCGGDFSTTQLTSAWETYQRQNVNYEKIFDRQIQNMDTTHKIDMISSAANVLTSTAKGAVGGSLAKNPNPAMIGLGAASGLVSGATGLITSEAKYRETKSYTEDIHNLQLGNVQALPNSLAKVDAYNNNNKIFVILERYTCTDKEKEILVNKLKYEGMTINAITDRLGDYVVDGKFLRANLIRLEGISEDSHLVNDIRDELLKGVYL